MEGRVPARRATGFDRRPHREEMVEAQGIAVGHVVMAHLQSHLRPPGRSVPDTVRLCMQAEAAPWLPYLASARGAAQGGRSYDRQVMPLRGWLAGAQPLDPGRGELTEASGAHGHRGAVSA